MANRLAYILHRAERFWCGVPPDTVTLILAVLERPDLLKVYGFWAIEQIAGHVFMSALLVIGVWVWPMLPAPVQEVLLEVRIRFLPSKAKPTEDHTPNMKSEEDKDPI